MRIFPTVLSIALSVLAFGVDAPAQTTLFFEDFESGYSRWTMEELWHAQTSPGLCTGGTTPYPSGSHCVWYGSPQTCTYGSTSGFSFRLTCTNAIVLPATVGSLELRYRSLSQAETFGLDYRYSELSVNGGAWTGIGSSFNSWQWIQEHFDITAFAGQTVRLRFTFHAGDIGYNDYLGWLLDDIGIVEWPGPAIEACNGDGTWIACPCGNSGAAGHGCASSFNPAGARLSASGQASLANDTVVLTSDGMSTAAATIFQGAQVLTFQAPSMGDGVSCIGPAYVRIRTQPAPGGVLSYPAASDPSISMRGGVTVPNTTRWYATRYRNSASFCTPSTFNVTNTLRILWHP